MKELKTSNIVSKERKHNKATKYKFRERFDYPLTKKLVKIIEQEYRDEAIDKGNSWRQECNLTYLVDKLDEEFQEVRLAISRGTFPNGYIQAELVDLILVAAMLHERLAGHKTGDDDTFQVEVEA